MFTIPKKVLVTGAAGGIGSARAFAARGSLVSLPLFLLMFLPIKSTAQEPGIIKIWDEGRHNAFTDLIHYRSFFYCTFREGISHVPKDTTENGRIRILRSTDGKTWESVALLTSDRYDLRDPKISVMPDKRIMVIMGGSHYVEGKLHDMLPHVSFSENGSGFSDPVPVSIEKEIRTNYDWIWRVTWRGNRCYGVVYQSGTHGNKNRIRLVTSEDGILYVQITDFDIESLPNEATVRFDNTGNMMILLRREGGANGLLGISAPPYCEWKWKELGYRLGGPDFLVLSTGRLCIGTRLYKAGSASTAIYLTDKSGTIEKVIELPSGGDTSYPGLVIFRNRLWITYYSSHEGKTSVYLAKIRMKDLLKS